MNKLITVHCDFDGTISQQDVIDLILEKLADPGWLDIEARWNEGEIGSRECLSKQIPLIRGGWNAIENLLKEVKLDPTFKTFSKWCLKEKIPVYIVSEGLKKIINALFLRENIEVTEIWSNKLELNKNGSFTIQFPHPPKSKKCDLGLCKCQVLERASVKELKVVIGDGLNDTCWAQEADLVFAKSKLLSYCRQNKIPCEPFENFSKIKFVLSEIIKGNILVVSGELVKDSRRVNSYAKRK